jgi:hypothetical protein
MPKANGIIVKPESLGKQPVAICSEITHPDRGSQGGR